MSNPTAGVPMFVVPGSAAEQFDWPLVSTAQTYYPGEMIGLNTSGYADKFDDTQSLLFLGLMAELERKTVDSGGSNGDVSLRIARPARFGILLSSVAITDTGKLAYASYSNQITLANTTTYGNVVGRVFKKADTNLGEVFPFPLTFRNAGGSRTLAATGNQTLTKWDLNKTIIVPNTAALSITLPAISTTQAGDFLQFIKTVDTNAATLDGNASETIDGATTLATMDAIYDCATLVSTGSEWVVVSRDIA